MRPFHPQADRFPPMHTLALVKPDGRSLTLYGRQPLLDIAAAHAEHISILSLHLDGRAATLALDGATGLLSSRSIDVVLVHDLGLPDAEGAPTMADAIESRLSKHGYRKFRSYGLAPSSPAVTGERSARSVFLSPVLNGRPEVHASGRDPAVARLAESGDAGVVAALRADLTAANERAAV